MIFIDRLIFFFLIFFTISFQGSHISWALENSCSQLFIHNYFESPTEKEIDLWDKYFANNPKIASILKHKSINELSISEFFKILDIVYGANKLKNKTTENSNSNFYLFQTISEQIRTRSFIETFNSTLGKNDLQLKNRFKIWSLKNSTLIQNFLGIVALKILDNISTYENAILLGVSFAMNLKMIDFNNLPQQIKDGIYHSGINSQLNAITNFYGWKIKFEYYSQYINHYSTVAFYFIVAAFFLDDFSKLFHINIFEKIENLFNSNDEYLREKALNQLIEFQKHSGPSNEEMNRENLIANINKLSNEELMQIIGE